MEKNQTNQMLDNMVLDLKSLKKHINSIPAIQSSFILTKLIKAISEIDAGYVNYCAECEDEGYGESGGVPGATYNSNRGVNMEMQIETSNWHEVSLLYRKLIAELKLPNYAPFVCSVCGRNDCYCEDK